MGGDNKMVLLLAVKVYHEMTYRRGQGAGHKSCIKRQPGQSGGAQNKPDHLEGVCLGS